MLACPTSVDLDHRQVHIWLVRPDDITDPTLLQAYDQLMTPEERLRRHRFRFEKDAHTFLVTRAMCRTTLSRYTHVRACDWHFEDNPYGRPHVRPGLSPRPLCFSLSHTDGLVACAVTLDRDVGVDVEHLDRRGETVSIADRFFSPLEVRTLRALPEPAQRERFFHYWTLKESYIKARGLGLRVPLEHFSFHLRDDSPIRITFDPRLPDDATAWQFRLLRPTDDHVLALGVRHPWEDALPVRVEWTIPLAD